MKLCFAPQGWEDYLYWQRTDGKVLKRINSLILDCQRGPFDGIGKPEPLKFELAGKWSRRINSEHLMVYEMRDGMLVILQCRYHY